MQARVALTEQRKFQTSSMHHLSLTKPTHTAPTLSRGALKVKKEDVQVLSVPTKTENSRPGIALNPASCASGLALLGGGGDWTPALSLSAHNEIMNDSQGSNSHTRSLPNQNEEWDDILLPRVLNMFLNLEGGR